ncbi:putative c6 zinc finger domain protein [Neofusicoccum parvum UCRNP2]|uniref:Putative c6 zinc finger domain protein n=1 Tax=Botryosphaeria parva (strain UCR-NP2) TaxID=1287680 RepID=R1GGH8_BOTPV|nr:putative c6 zinc finger domain protein [Neofusicoccum parvum UCRNP2]
MFGTLHYDRGSKHSEFIDRTQGFLGDAAAERAACDSCRAKKLKCSGQRAGCDRCKTLEMACVYSAVAGGAQGAESRRRKRAASQRQKQQQQQEREQQHQQHQQQQLQHDGGQPAPAAPPATVTAATTTAAPAPSLMLTPQPPPTCASPVDPLFRFPSTPSDGLDLFFADDLLPDLLLASPPALGDAAAGPDSFSMLASALLPSPALSSPAAGSAVDASKPCGCLATVVELLEELDALARPTLDVALASHKLFLNRALRVLNCSGCRARSEHMVLLTRVCDKLVRLAERIVLSYLQLDAAAPTPRSSLTSTSSSACSLSQPPSPSFPCPPAESLFLGCYETDPSEWDSLVRVILSLQLRSLGTLLAGVRRSASSPQQPRLQVAETKVRLLADELQRYTRSLGKPGA